VIGDAHHVISLLGVQPLQWRVMFFPDREPPARPEIKSEPEARGPKEHEDAPSGWRTRREYML
jgi:hypothetical protein